LLRRFADVPMSLADACLVRMTEIFDSSSVLTLDRDFKVYRRFRRQKIPVIFPDAN
jgi:predicted nucleic acid-binding protein